MGVFIDSSVFVAYYNERDLHHKASVELIKKCVEGDFGELFTSDYVFDEAVTVTFVKTGLKKAVELGHYLLNSEVSLLEVDRDAFNTAWERFKSVEMSFTDCTNIAVMRLHGIDKILTFDRGFKQVKEIKVIP
ncbi:MAG: PIN domain-containing protein [Candidatus Hydrothermarchaeales archaeon]